MLYAIAALIVALLCVLIWVNVALVRSSGSNRQAPQGDKGGRKPHGASATADEAAEVAAAVGGSAPDAGVKQHPVPDASAAFAEIPNLASGAEAGAQAAHGARGYADHDAGDGRATGVDTQGHGEGEASTSRLQPAVAHAAGATPVEVVQTGHSGQKLFQRGNLPYVLNDVSVPVFAESPWRRCFDALCQEPSVVGWVAFSGETVGAADRDYDEHFLDVLRQYRRSVLKLRKEVGLSQLEEMTVTGDEGQVYVWTAIDDIWMVLFVERQADVRQLAARSLASVREVISRPGPA